MADYGIKIAQEGYDISSTTDKELVFSSEFNTLKLHFQGTGTANPKNAGAAVTVFIAHNLSYIPAYTVYTEIDKVLGADDNYYLAPHTYPVGGDGSIVAYCDSTNLNIRFGANLLGPSTDDGVDYKYNIYLNEGSD